MTANYEYSRSNRENLKICLPQPATLLKKRLWHRCFPVNFAKFLRTPFLQNNFGRLLLKQMIFGQIMKILANKFFSKFEQIQENLLLKLKCSHLPKNFLTRKKFFPREKIWEPQNTHKNIFWTYEIPTRKSFGPMKYPWRHDGTTALHTW